MKEFTTANGTKLFYEVDYQKGGLNYFTNEFEDRGYILSIERNPQEQSAFSDLNDTCGAIRYFMFEVGRQSKKQAQRANDLALKTLKETLAKHYPNL